MKKSRLLLIFLFVFCLLSIVQLNVFAQEAVKEIETAVLVDDFDREITVNYPLGSIVSLAPSVTEMICATDSCAKLVGVDAYSNYPESVDELEEVGSLTGELSLEKILALNPDLVIAAEINSPEQIKGLEDIGIPVYRIKNPTDLESMPELFRKFGEILDESERMEAVAARFETRLGEIRKLLKDAEAVSVFYEIDASDPTSPWTTGSGTFIDSLIQEAGGKNIAAEMDGEWLQISVEFLIEADPETIVLGDANYGVTPESLSERDGWGDLSAVVNGAILSVDSDIVSRPAPRIIEALEILAQFLHPALFLNEAAN